MDYLREFDLYIGIELIVYIFRANHFFSKVDVSYAKGSITIK